MLTAIEPAAREFLLTGSLWTPANFFAVAIENIHLMTGTSWPVTIALFTVGLRAALFPFTVKQTRSSVLATNLKPTLDRLRTESMQHRTAGNTDLAKDKMAEMQALMKENGVGPGRLLAYGLIPAPFFVATFFALKAMTEQALPSMLTGGAFWFTDLCAADPYYILPCLTTATLLLVNEVQLTSCSLLSSLDFFQAESDGAVAGDANVHAHVHLRLHPYHRRHAICKNIQDVFYSLLLGHGVLLCH